MVNFDLYFSQRKLMKMIKMSLPLNNAIFLDENTEMLQIADFLVRGFFELFRSKNNKQKFKK